MNYKKHFIHFTENSTEKEIEKTLLQSQIKDSTYEQLLDVGCGTGELTNIIINQFQSVDCVDVNKRFASYHTKENVSFFHDSIETFETKKQYDVIVAGHIFPYIQEHKRGVILKKLISLLKNNGKLILFEMTTDGDLGLIKEIVAGGEIISTYDTIQPYLFMTNHTSKKFLTEITTKSLNDMLMVLAFFTEKYNGNFVKKKDVISEYVRESLLNTTGKKYTLKTYNRMVIVEKI